MTAQQFQALAQILRLRQGSTREAVRLHMVAGLTVPDAARVAGVKYQLALKAVKRAKDGHNLAIAATMPQTEAK
jgi:DNA-directed RNA polymerase specialized sigma24 family protein